MTDWNKIIEAGYRPPADRALSVLVDELSEALRSRDPIVRDEQAYAILATWMERGDLEPAILFRLGDAMARRFEDPEIQARTFAALTLDRVVAAGVFAPDWVDVFCAWYPGEEDLRGYDPDLGWLHAVAHGADLLGTFGRCRQVEPQRMLELAAARLLAPTEYILRDQEDDRLAHAIALTLTRPELTAETATAWLAPLDADLHHRPSGTVPAAHTNLMRTLRVLYLLLDRGVRPGWHGETVIPISHCDHLKEQIAIVLARVAPYAG